MVQRGVMVSHRAGRTCVDRAIGDPVTPIHANVA
jgi:hypothetical protein